MTRRRRSAQEALAYEIVRGARGDRLRVEDHMLAVVVADLHRAERILSEVDARAPDAERALHLVAIRAAITQLETFVRPLAKG